MRQWLKDLVVRAATEIGTELQHKISHGAHEASALLFTGSGYVMYPRGTKEDPKIENAGQETQRELGREM